MLVILNKIKQNYCLTTIFMLLVSILSCQTPKPTMETFKWLPTECAPKLYPINIAKGFLLFEDGNEIAIPSADPVKNGWGMHGSTEVIGPEEKPVPFKLEITWLSYTENKFYGGTFNLPKDLITKLFKTGYIDPVTLKPSTYDCIVAGMAPGGIVVVWIQGINNQVEIGRYQAAESNMTMDEYISVKGFSPEMSHNRAEVCKSILDQEPEVFSNFKTKGLQLGLWDIYRERFTLRPVMAIEQSHHAKTTGIYMQFYNGEQEDLVLDKLVKNDFIQRARIKKVTFKWSDNWAGKTQKYILELNHIDEEEIFEAYKQVYAGNPDQEAELKLKVTPGNDHYRLYLQSKIKTVEIQKITGEIYLDE